MALTCISGKRVFDTEAMAEDVLIELWTKNDYAPHSGPVSVYRCEDCGLYHLTSKGPMNHKLSAFLESDKYRIGREASKWNDKFRKK